MIPVWVADAGIQSSFPAWVATTETTPSPVKNNVFPEIRPGPDSTEKVTGSPLLAVADKVT